MRSGAPSGARRQDQPTTSRALRGGRVPREGLQRDRRRPAFAALQLRVRRRSAASRRTSSASHRSLHNAARLLVTSMAESTPKPTRAMLPAMNPAASATAHSAEFHAMVRYCKVRPWRAARPRGGPPSICRWPCSSAAVLDGSKLIDRRADSHRQTADGTAMRPPRAILLRRGMGS